MEFSSEDFTGSFFRGDAAGVVAVDPCLRRLPTDEEDLSEVLPAAFDARFVMALAVLSRARVAMDSKLPRVERGVEVLPRPGELGLKEGESEGESEGDCVEVNLPELRRPAVESGSWWYSCGNLKFTSGQAAVMYGDGDDKS